MKDINLLPEEIKSTSSYTPEKSGTGGIAKLITALVVIGVIVGATVLAPQMYVKSLESELEKLKTEINDPKYAEVKQVRNEIDTVNAVLASKQDIMDTIDSASNPINEIVVSLNNAIPSGCMLTGISLDRNKLDITGVAVDNVALAELVSR